MEDTVKVTATYGKYTEKELMEMEPVALGALLRERTHHMIEVPLYPSLLKESGKTKTNFGIPKMYLTFGGKGDSLKIRQISSGLRNIFPSQRKSDPVKRLS